MKNITPFIGLGLIVVVLLLGFIGYRQDAIFEQTAKQMEEMNQRHSIQLDSLESLKTLIINQDSLIKKQNEKLKYIENQNNALYDRYSNISIKLPEL